MTDKKTEQLLDLVKIGSTVRQQREFLALTQQKLADEAGVHRNQVARLERGAANSTTLLIKVVDALGLNTCEFWAISEGVPSPITKGVPSVRIEWGDDVFICDEVRRG